MPFASLLARTLRPALGRHVGEGGAPGAARGNTGLAHPANGEADLRCDGAVRGRKQSIGDDATEGGPAADEDAGPGARPPRATAGELDSLDPLARHAAHLAPPVMPGGASDGATSAAANEPVRARSLEELLPALVRRIAWAGDRHKGTVHLELGAGAYAGTTVTVHADAGRVRVELGGAEGPELDRLRARLDARLRAHGLDVESVT